MTLYELDEDKVKPKRRCDSPSGTHHFVCGICGQIVGIHSGRCNHLEGWLLKRDVCKNGHSVDWGEVNE